PREPKRAPLGDVICGSQLPDDLAPRPGRHNLFPRTSFSAWRLRAWSATIRFSWRFSSSSCLSRFASETSMPPYFRFQAYRVSRLMPSRRHSSRTFAPASASLTAATFCSSVNLLLRMTPPRSVRRSQIISGSGFGGQLIGSVVFDRRRYLVVKSMLRLTLELEGVDQVGGWGYNYIDRREGKRTAAESCIRVTALSNWRCRNQCSAIGSGIHYSNIGLSKPANC